jgi:general secretion pathway protein F
MATFRYRAIGPTGDVQTGMMDAATQAEVIARLQRQGSMPMRAEAAGRESWLAAIWHTEFATGRGLRRQEMADMIRELATMLSAGQDLDRAFRYLHETAPNARVRVMAERLRDIIRDGGTLAEAMARYPHGFTKLHVALVRAGEASWQLGSALARLADLLERQQKLAAAVISALIYPSLLIVVAIIAITLLLTEVLPQFVPLFEQSGAKLPTSTQFLISAGAFVSQNGLFMLLGLAVLLLIVRAMLRMPRIRLRADRLVLRVPIAGGLLREVLAARFTRVLGTLLVSRVPLITAVGIVREALGNHAAMAAVDHAAVSARAGGGLARPLAEARIFPTRTTHLLRLGEENAELGPIALRAAEIHEERTRIALERLVALLVPAVTIIMGIAVAGIVTSLMTAMLSLNDLTAG